MGNLNGGTMCILESVPGLHERASFGLNIGGT